MFVSIVSFASVKVQKTVEHFLHSHFCFISHLYSVYIDLQWHPLEYGFVAITTLELHTHQHVFLWINVRMKTCHINPRGSRPRPLTGQPHKYQVQTHILIYICRRWVRTAALINSFSIAGVDEVLRPVLILLSYFDLVCSVLGSAIINKHTQRTKHHIVTLIVL